MIGRLVLLAALPLLATCVTASTPPPPNAPSAPSFLTAPTADAGYVDPTESSKPIAMPPLFGDGSPPPSFPKAVTSDIGCLGNVRATGQHEADYASLVAACGAPTGLAEYAHAVSGKLHGLNDKSDSYSLRLAGGYCYRAFAAGDQSIFDLDVHVRAATGAPVASDTTTAPIAVAGADQPFCIATTGDYVFDLEVDGLGFGAYTFGVWARPGD